MTTVSDVTDAQPARSRVDRWKLKPSNYFSQTIRKNVTEETSGTQSKTHQTIKSTKIIASHLMNLFLI